MLTIKNSIDSLHERDGPNEYIIIERRSESIIFKGSLEELESLLESDIETQKTILKKKFDVTIYDGMNSLGVLQAKRISGPDKLSDSLNTIKITLAKL